MNRIFFGFVLVVFLFLVNGCSIYSGRTPLWYDYSDINMADYTENKIILLPLVSETGNKLEHRGQKELIGSIQSQFKRVFDVKPQFLSQEELTRAGFSKPYDMTKIAQHYDAQAVLIASIFDVVKTMSRSNKVEYTNVGLKLSCFDASDQYKYWRLSKRYYSDAGFNVKNIDFDYVLYTDLKNIRKIVSSGAEGKNTKSIADKSAPSIVVATGETKISKQARDSGSSFQTTAQMVDIKISVLDAYGISQLIVSNEENEFVDQIDVSSGEIKRMNEIFTVPVEEGNNKIRIHAINVEQEESTRILTVKRETKISTHVIAVSSPYAVKKRIYGDTKRSLAALNSKSSRRYDNLIYVDQTSATRKEILRILEMLSNQAYVDDNLYPVLFFSGWVQKVSDKRGRDKYYLMLGDSEIDYLRSTAIDLDEVLELLGPNVFVMLEYCSVEPERRGDYRLKDLPVKINVYSCQRAVGDMSETFIDHYRQNRTLEKIVAFQKSSFEKLPLINEGSRYAF